MSSFVHKSMRSMRWSKAEIAKLKRRLREGLPIDCVVISGRTPTAIKLKARELGLKIGGRWTPEQEEKLRKAVENGKDITKLEILHPITGEQRSVIAIKSKVKRMGLIPRVDPKTKWTKQEERLLLVCLEKGDTPEQIKEKGLFGPDRVTKNGGLLPERSTNAIRKKARRLGFILDEERAQRTSESKKNMDKETSKELDDFIKKNGKVVPSHVIAKKFGVSGSTVRRRRAQLGIKVSWRDAMKMEASKNRDPRRKEIRAERVRKSWRTRRTRDQLA